MPKLDPPESLLATALGTRIARTAKMTAPPTTWKSGLAGPGAQIHVKAELRPHVVVQRLASAKGAQMGADSGEKRQFDRLLLVSLGEGRLTVRMVKDKSRRPRGSMRSRSLG